MAALYVAVFGLVFKGRFRFFPVKPEWITPSGSSSV